MEKSELLKLVGDLHDQSDLDVEPSSQHHTLGSGPSQAASGTHKHTIPVGGGGNPADSGVRISLSWDADRNSLWVLADGLWVQTGVAECTSLSDFTTPRNRLVAYESDTNSVYYFNGTDWIFLGGDGPAWSAFPSAAGWLGLGGGYGFPLYRIVNNSVEFSGVLSTSVNKANGSNVATGLPGPNENRILTTVGSNGHARLDVSTSGTMILNGGGTILTGGFVSLDNLSYPIVAS